MSYNKVRYIEVQSTSSLVVLHLIPTLQLCCSYI